MLRRDTDTPIGKACERRFPAWTRYARAFSGNRGDAEDIVRGAVHRSLQHSHRFENEADVHDVVVSEICSAALELLHRREKEDAAQPSVLRFLSEKGDESVARRAADLAAEELGRLPAQQRRALELLLLRQRPSPLTEVAHKQGVDVDTLSDRIEMGLDRLATAIHAADRGGHLRGHADVRRLTAYVDGALTGDEARALVEHCGACSECGDRLGTMILLRSRAAEAIRPPRVPRRARVAALAAAVVLGLVTGALLYRQFASNPWGAHATQQTVPRWYHDFLYGYREQVATNNRAAAEGLELLVRGQYEEAITKLEPLVEAPVRNAEAAAYLGIARYMTGDTSAATIDLLTVGTASNRAGRLADWYLCNALLARGRVSQARRRLLSLAFINDWVGREAKALLERLDRTAPVVSG